MNVFLLLTNAKLFFPQLWNMVYPPITQFLLVPSIWQISLSSRLGYWWLYLKRFRPYLQVLGHLLYLMRVREKIIQRRVALVLAHLCSPDDQKTIFIDNGGVFSVTILRMIFLAVLVRLWQFVHHVYYVIVGLELLLELLESTNMKHQRDGSVALCQLANKTSSLSPVDAAPPSPTPQVYF